MSFWDEVNEKRKGITIGKVGDGLARVGAGLATGGLSELPSAQNFINDQILPAARKPIETGLRIGAGLATGGLSELPGVRKIAGTDGGGGTFLPGLKSGWEDVTGVTAANAAKEAAAGQTTAGDRALDENRRQFDLSRSDMAPWLASGKRALDESDSLMGFGGDTAGMMKALQSSPGYQARLMQGERSLKAQTAAGGGVGSGKAMVAANSFGQDYASNEYDKRLNQLALKSGMGRDTSGAMAGLSANFAANQGNIYTGVANAQGAAGIAGANSRQSGLLGVLGLGARAFGAR